MKVVVAKVAGFCYGVDRAYDLLKDAVSDRKENEKVSTFGPLIHNDRIIKELSEDGVDVYENADMVEGTVVVRSHGISDKKKEILKKRSKKLIDATCPYVTKVHVMAQLYEKQGRQVVVVGDPNHPEMKGIIEDLKSPICLQAVEEAQNLDHFPSIGAVSQTTLRREKFLEVCEILKSKCDDFIFQDTICTATTDRQDAIRELAQKVDAVIVIGGTKSSNTKKLQEVAAQYCPAQKVESVDGINTEALKGVKTVGVSAGASTPQNQIDEIVAFLESL